MQNYWSQNQTVTMCIAKGCFSWCISKTVGKKALCEQGESLCVDLQGWICMLAGREGIDWSSASS